MNMDEHREWFSSFFDEPLAGGRCCVVCTGLPRRRLLRFAGCVAPSTVVPSGAPSRATASGRDVKRTKSLMMCHMIVCHMKKRPFKRTSTSRATPTNGFWSIVLFPGGL